jgi:hypothetical protein
MGNRCGRTNGDQSPSANTCIYILLLLLLLYIEKLTSSGDASLGALV